MHRESFISTRASGVVVGYPRGFASFLAILVHFSKRARGWSEGLCLPASDPRRKKEEGGANANLSKVSIHAVG